MKDNIYVQFVSILSIFSAIIFSFFSVAKMAVSYFSELSNNVPIHRIMMFTSLIGISILSIIFLLLKFVTTLVDKDVEKPLKLKKIHVPFPTFIIGISILLLTFISSIVYDYLNN